MATRGDGKAPYGSGGSGEKFHKRSSSPEIDEEPQNVSHEEVKNVSQEAGGQKMKNSTGDSELNTHKGVDFASFCAIIGISELEQILKHKTFTRSETERLIALLHSVTITEETPPSDIIVVETDGALSSSAASGSLIIKHKLGDQRDDSVVGSRVSIEEEIASPAEIAPLANNNNATCFPKTPMASPQPPATMENLPEELLSNIFIRLLARQLAQMRSVNKSWNALLSQPSFIKSHLRHSIHNSDQILLHFSDRYSFGSKRFKPLNCPSPHLQEQLTNFIKLPPFTPRSKHTQITLIGSVNGLICSFNNNDSDIHIWNPSLSAVSTLPPYSMPCGDYDTLNISFRYGFDPKTDDYKLVKLTGFTGSSHNDVEWWLDVEVYSMRKGSWKLITERFPSHVTGIHNGDIVCRDGRNGHLHWLCRAGKSWNPKTIVAFDLGSETFREMPLPDPIPERNNFENILGVLTGKLCMMSWGDGTCELWVMEEYGVAESWVKRHVFSHFSDDAYPFGFTSRDDFLFQDPYGRLVLFPVIKQAKILEDDCEYEIYIDKFVEYVDSLVWVASAKREMVDDAGQN